MSSKYKPVKLGERIKQIEENLRVIKALKECTE